MNQQLWQAILQLKKEVTAWSDAPEFCCWSPLENRLDLNEIPSDTDSPLIYIHFVVPATRSTADTHFLWTENLQMELLQSGSFGDQQIDFLRAYLPYCFYAIQAKKDKRAFSIAHFAQTLDGKIATNTGHSKWIGNKENLEHAHRMRALCDAILIGRLTLDYDRPQLTVRLVPGENPSRIVLGEKESDYSCLFEACEDPIWVISSDQHPDKGGVNYVHLPRDNGRFKSQQILECLYEKGLHTVYIEGGSLTTSNFIKDRSVDILQLHLSPQIFGSGRPSIQLPEIEVVQEAIQFSTFDFQKIGDTRMFVGHINKEV